jgi:hypothetical protein
MYNLIASLILLIPTGDKVEGKETYHLIVGDKAYEYVYIEEVENFYKTGKFEYNEELTTKTK